MNDWWIRKVTGAEGDVVAVVTAIYGEVSVEITREPKRLMPAETRALADLLVAAAAVAASD